MTHTQTGWLLFLAAFGMILGLLAPEIGALADWAAVTAPSFVAKLLGHLAAVIGAFVGGRLIPTTHESSHG